MASKNTIEIVITGKNKADPALDEVHGKLSGLKKVLGGVGIAAAGLATGGLVLAAGAVGGLAAALFDCVGEAMAAEEVQAQLNAVLESTKGAAGVSAQLVNNLAQEYQNLTRFEDDAIVAGESLLLTFTNIGIDVFPEATAAMLDMSAALGQDLQTSAMQLGKALNDPIAGVTALRRVGVQLTDAQEETIKKMVEMGDVAGAQKIILQELNTEFGGSAVAAGDTFAGKLDILNNKFGDVKEQIGGALIPALTELADQFITFMGTEEFQSALDEVTRFISEEALPKFQELVAWLIAEGVPAFQSFSTWMRDEGIPAIQDLVAFIGTMADTVGTVIDKINELIETMKMLKKLAEEGVSIFGPESAFGRKSALEQAAEQYAGGFQFGGVVPGPVGRPMLATVHGGERITPPGQGGGGESMLVDVPVEVSIDGEVIARALGRRMARMRQAGGVTGI